MLHLIHFSFCPLDTFPARAVSTQLPYIAHSDARFSAFPALCCAVPRPPLASRAGRGKPGGARRCRCRTGTPSRLPSARQAPSEAAAPPFPRSHLYAQGDALRRLTGSRTLLSGGGRVPAGQLALCWRPGGSGCRVWWKALSMPAASRPYSCSSSSSGRSPQLRVRAGRCLGALAASGRSGSSAAQSSASSAASAARTCNDAAVRGDGDTGDTEPARAPQPPARSPLPCLAAWRPGCFSSREPGRAAGCGAAPCHWLSRRRSCWKSAPRLTASPLASPARNMFGRAHGGAGRSAPGAGRSRIPALPAAPGTPRARTDPGPGSRRPAPGPRRRHPAEPPARRSPQARGCRREPRSPSHPTGGTGRSRAVPSPAGTLGIQWHPLGQGSRLRQRDSAQSEPKCQG